MTELKKKVAEEALKYVKDHKIIGLGSGSTVNQFIEALVKYKSQLEGCVVASRETENCLKAHGLPIIELNALGYIPIYFDGADEVNFLKETIKGGGAALAREKVLATVAETWICMVDESKLVEKLGRGPLPVEVIPMARSVVAREIVKLGGDPVYREGVVTDNHNCILDVYNLDMNHPRELEETLKLIPGVLDNGLFSKRCADRVIVAGRDRMEEF